QTNRERVGDDGLLEVRRIRAASYDKSRNMSRLIWSFRTNIRLIWEVIRDPASRRAEVIFTGAPPFMLFFAVLARYLRGARLTYHTTDSYPEVIIATTGGISLVLGLRQRATWFFRRRLDPSEALGEDQRRLLQAGVTPANRITDKRAPSPIQIPETNPPLE